MSEVGKPQMARRPGTLLVICSAATAVLGSLTSLVLLSAASRAAPVYYVAAGAAFALGGIVGYVVALRGFARVSALGRGRAVVLAALVDVLSLLAPWVLAAMTGTMGRGAFV